MSDKLEKSEELLRVLPNQIREMLQKCGINFEYLMEIRFRVDKPLILVYNNREYYLTKNGKLSKYPENVYVLNHRELKEIIEYVSNYSLYAFEEELKQGFITIMGGHRVGVTGKTVLEDGKVKTIKNISSINIRVSHQVKDCAKAVIPYIFGEESVMHTLIISPPRCGKTTLLRDIIRLLSEAGSTVGVVDERSEIGACYMGVPQNDLGSRTDVLDCCPKSEGMMMLIRAMSPDVVAVDEIGNSSDMEAIEYVINCGCKIVATVHGNSIDDIRNKPTLGKMVRKRVFERYIVMNNKKEIGRVEEIFDARGNVVYKGNW